MAPCPTTPGRYRALPAPFARTGKRAENRCGTGLNSALKEVFLEAYLDKPIEQVISQQLCTPVDRARGVECSQSKNREYLIFHPTVSLARPGGLSLDSVHRDPLRTSSGRRHGLSLHTIGEAKAERVNAADSWGS